jgi:hypothetical protein
MSEAWLRVRGRVEHCPNPIRADRGARQVKVRASLGNIQVLRFWSLEGRL